MSCPCGHNAAGYEVTPERVLTSLRMKPDQPGWWAVHRVVLEAHSEVQEIAIVELPTGTEYRINRAVLEHFGTHTTDAIWLAVRHWRAARAGVKQLSLEGT